MSGFEPIIYIISAIATETIKDVGKHLGKKAYEIETSLREPIIQLGINDPVNPEEIQQKLDEKPEIKAEIEHKIADNHDIFDKLLPVLKEKFNNYSKTNKNDANLTISRIKGSTITTNIHQNNGKISNNHFPVMVAIVAIMAIFGVIVFALIRFEQFINPNTNINSVTNTQTNVNLTNTNNIISNSNKEIAKPIVNNPRPISTSTESKEKQTSNQNKNVGKVDKEGIVNSDNNRKNAQLPLCAETEDPNDGC